MKASGSRRGARSGNALDLAALLGSVTVGEPVTWQGLEVFPLTQPNGHPPTYALVEDLLESGRVQITEVGEHGHVPTLLLENNSDTDALILDGMELRGAKQNRMVNVTVVAGKGVRTEIPVSCVEQGRWSYRSRGFESSGRTVAHKLRRRKAEMVAECLRRERRAATDQGEVWDGVEEYIESVQAAAPTRALDDVFACREQSTRDCVDVLGGIDAYGAVVALNGRIVGFDLLDNRATFGKLWRMMLRGYALDAVVEEGSSGAHASREQVADWLRSVAGSARVSRHDEVPGVGKFYAVNAPHLVGNVTTLGDKAIHVALFPA